MLADQTVVNMKFENGYYKIDELDQWKIDRLELVCEILSKLYKKPKSTNDLLSSIFIYHRNQIFDWIYKNYKNKNVEFLTKLWRTKLKKHEIKKDFKN